MKLANARQIRHGLFFASEAISSPNRQRLAKFTSPSVLPPDKNSAIEGATLPALGDSVQDLGKDRHFQRLCSDAGFRFCVASLFVSARYGEGEHDRKSILTLSGGEVRSAGIRGLTWTCVTIGRACARTVLGTLRTVLRSDTQQVEQS